MPHKAKRKNPNRDSPQVSAIPGYVTSGTEPGEGAASSGANETPPSPLATPVQAATASQDYGNRGSGLEVRKTSQPAPKRSRVGDDSVDSGGDSDDEQADGGPRENLEEPGPGKKRKWRTVTLPHNQPVKTIETAVGRILHMTWYQGMDIIRIDDHFNRSGKPPAFPVHFNIHTELSLKRGFLRRRPGTTVSLFKFAKKKGGHTGQIWVTANVFLTVAAVFQYTYEVFGAVEFLTEELKRVTCLLKPEPPVIPEEQPVESDNEGGTDGVFRVAGEAGFVQEDQRRSAALLKPRNVESSQGQPHPHPPTNGAEN